MQVAFWQNVVVASLVVPFAFTHLGSTSLAGSVFCTGLSQFLLVKSLERLEARTAGMIIALLAAARKAPAEQGDTSRCAH